MLAGESYVTLHYTMYALPIQSAQFDPSGTYNHNNHYENARKSAKLYQEDVNIVQLTSLTKVAANSGSA